MTESTEKWFRYLVETNEGVLCEMCGEHGHETGACPHHDGHDTRKVAPHDREGKMAKRQLYKIMNYAKEIHDNLHDNDELESWVQSKIATMSHMIGSVKHYLEYEYKKDLMEEE
tara:strand:- start:954 stop:1295 length:342 start_codon:yes stop_codon:yes gene_type:complete